MGSIRFGRRLRRGWDDTLLDNKNSSSWRFDYEMALPLQPYSLQIWLVGQTEAANDLQIRSTISRFRYDVLYLSRRKPSSPQTHELLQFVDLEKRIGRGVLLFVNKVWALGVLKLQG